MRSAAVTTEKNAFIRNSLWWLVRCLTSIRRQFVVYFSLHKGEVCRKTRQDGKPALQSEAILPANFCERAAASRSRHRLAGGRVASCRHPPLVSIHVTRCQSLRACASICAKESSDRRPPFRSAGGVGDPQSQGRKKTILSLCPTPAFQRTHTLASPLARA